MHSFLPYSLASLMFLRISPSVFDSNNLATPYSGFAVVITCPSPCLALFFCFFLDKYYLSFLSGPSSSVMAFLGCHHRRCLTRFLSMHKLFCLHRCQHIATLIHRIARVSFYPAEINIMSGRKLQKLIPEICVLCRVSISFTPPVCAPSFCPAFAHAVHHILRIGA